ncbi:MAG: DNA mismatch repair protein MutS [Bacteroidetes bacterium]|nr:DNA mismatch repair protein MutS [Bacteroidota bacterium]
MKQYNSIKAKYPDAILLFRIGDFYETFGEDAVKTSRVLGIVLTKRANGAAAFVDLAGFPHHALDSYLPKLVRAGYRVAICDQLEDPKFAKKIVKRGVTELVTPGVTYNDKILEQRENNFLASIFPGENNEGGVAFLDVSTGEFYVAQGQYSYIDKLVQGFSPNEIIYPKSKDNLVHELFGDKFCEYSMEDWIYGYDFSYDLLKRHFQTNSLKGFGIEDYPAGIIAAGAALHYLADTQHDRVKHITSIARIEEEHYVWLDRFTVRNLELVHSLHEKGGTLLEVLDRTITPMGSRMLKRWLCLPLKEKQPIDERLDIIETLAGNPELRDVLHQNIKLIGDLERLISKAATGRINPREVVHLRRALNALEPIRNSCMTSGNPGLLRIAEQINLCPAIREQIGKTLAEDPPAQLNKGRVIAEGVSDELDELRKIAYSGKDYLLQIQKREIHNTGIGSLKVGFNNIFGYYIEVTNPHKHKVPGEWIRKQTLVNAERYITEELKIYEEKILGAEEKISALETKLFNDLILAVQEYIAPIQLNGSLISRLDCLLSFAVTALQNDYCRPEINETKIIDIRQGRHPVIETKLPPGESYIANDIYLDNDTHQVIILTGPNMSGKSALLRQAALITLMAQMGSFVPAKSAKIGMVDKIFTRVGASDNISLGESTFMVEMTETSSILNNLSERSLIILDEIGRGTSTYDGISIAWAISEHLHRHSMRPKTLFATHYHELNEMAKHFERIKNFNISVKETGNKVIFLRKMVAGESQHSFGIHVARMAGMPKQVVERANEVLEYLESSHNREIAVGGSDAMSAKKEKQSGKNIPPPPINIGAVEGNRQLNIFSVDDPLLLKIKEELDKIEPDALSPIEALIKLNELKKMIE